MAILSPNVLTLADWAKRLDPEGKVDTIVELLSQKNEILDDMLWMEGNLPTGHRTTIRTGLPALAWRLLNQGIQPTKSTTMQIDDTCGMLEGYSEVDKDLADLNGNTAQFRLSEASAFIEGLNQNMAGTLFYGNTAVNPERFLGLAPRFSAISGATNGQNVISGAGSASNNTSIWLVCWGPTTVHGIFPKASKAGVTHTDKGIVTIENTNGQAGFRSEAYREHWQWKCGLSVRDWRYVVRIANIDVTQLTKDYSAGADVVDLMTQALEKAFDLKTGRPVWYVNRKIRSFLRRQMVNHKNMFMADFDMQSGEKPHVLTFGGFPVRLCDQLLNTEATVS